jgi:two-component system phosphate regulon response regulator PhoB
MAKELIWVVDDEDDILELLQYNLSREGYTVTCFSTGESALKAAAQSTPDLILLDLMLPGIGGLDVCRILKQSEKSRQIPIIMLTARGEEADIVTGLELGADDYITKPFSPRILIARARAVLRRIQDTIPSDDQSLKIEDMVIHPGQFSVQISDRSVDLTATEFRMLHLLAKRPGWVFTRGQIVDAIHGEDYAVTERSVDVQIAGLRKKLGDYGDCLETVRGVGYRFRVRS